VITCRGGGGKKDCEVETSGRLASANKERDFGDQIREKGAPFWHWEKGGGGHGRRPESGVWKRRQSGVWSFAGVSVMEESSEMNKEFERGLR